MVMTRVDNSGAGNCMYFAYSISLMYYLRHQPIDVKRRIFARLGLDEGAQTELNALCEHREGLFNVAQIRRIEGILHIPCRRLTARAIIKEFQDTPKGSPLFAAVLVAFEWEMRAQLQTEHADYIPYITPSGETAATLSSAEIFKVSRVMSAIPAFVSTRIPHEIARFRDECFKVLTDDTRKTASMSDIIQDMVVLFFQQNEYEHLRTYATHVETPPTWGSEESLLSLHRAIQGEELRGGDGEREWVCDVRISLSIFKDAERASDPTQPAEPAMALQNLGNYHWVSLIPTAQLSLSATTETIPFRPQAVARPSPAPPVPSPAAPPATPPVAPPATPPATPPVAPPATPPVAPPATPPVAPQEPINLWRDIKVGASVGTAVGAVLGVIAVGGLILASFALTGGIVGIALPFGLALAPFAGIVVSAGAMLGLALGIVVGSVIARFRAKPVSPPVRTNPAEEAQENFYASSNKHLPPASVPPYHGPSPLQSSGAHPPAPPGCQPEPLHAVEPC